METITANLSGKARREVLHGREYLVARLTLIVPGVLNGSNGPLLYPPEQVGRSPASWNHMPIVVYHPMKDGKPISARQPSVINKQGIGFVFESEYSDKLQAEGWFDQVLTQNYDRFLEDKHKMWPRLEKGEPIELSTGLNLELVDAPQGAVHNGRPYTHSTTNYVPDHLAVLPDEVGACSVKDGCGVHNQERSLFQRFIDWFTGNVSQTGEGEAVTNELVTNPYPNEHAARVEDPSNFIKDTFRRKEITAGVSVIMAKKTKDGPMMVQAYRFSKDKFTAAEAREWLKKHDIKAHLEAATGNAVCQDMRTTSSDTTTTNQQMSHDELRKQLTDLLMKKHMEEMKTVKGMKETAGMSGMMPEEDMMSMPYPQAVFDKEVVYSHKGKLWKTGYSTDLRSGSVSLSPDRPKEVRRVVTYKTVTNGEGVTSQQEQTDYVQCEEVTVTRTETINFLVANCTCWKGKESELAKLPDSVINDLKAGYDTQAQNNALLSQVTNQGYTDPQGNTIVFNVQTKAWDVKPKAVSPPVPVVPDTTTPTNNAHRLTQEEQEDLAFARSEKNRQKTQFVSRLTANISDPALKQQNATWLMTKPLEELRVLSGLVPAPAPTANLLDQILPPAPAQPDYTGAAGGQVINVGGEDEEVLAMPVMNFEEDAMPGLRRKQA